MVKTCTHFTLIALSACSVLAVPLAYQRREVSVAPDILEERDYAPTMYKRELEADTASLQEREPILGLFGSLGEMGVNIGTNLATTAIEAKMAADANRPPRPHVPKPKKPRRRNNRRKRDLEAEDELDLGAREDMDEFVERELDVLEREMNEDGDLLGREFEEDLYLD